jgi:cytochrome c553
MPKKLIFLTLLSVLFLSAVASAHAKAGNNPANAITAGRKLVIASGCMRCHSLVKGRQIKGIDSLAGFGGRGLSIKETEQAIRSCGKADNACRDFTDKQVKYIAYYLNSLKTKKQDYSPVVKK